MSHLDDHSSDRPTGGLTERKGYMLKAVLVACINLTFAIIYARLATSYNLALPPNWLGFLLAADGEYSYDMAYLSLVIDLQVAGFLLWWIFRTLFHT